MGEPLVVHGAQLRCVFGAAPCFLAVAPKIVTAGTPAATILDFTPANIATFVMCSSPANPAVSAATAAASGVLTPQACLPLVTGQWAPGSPKVTVGGVRALTPSSTCTCAYGGLISISNPGQVTVTG